MKSNEPLFRIDKTKFSVGSLHDEPDDKKFWLQKLPHERLQSIELVRQILYGYRNTTKRLQRVFEITELLQS